MSFSSSTPASRVRALCESYRYAGPTSITNNLNVHYLTELAFIEQARQIIKVGDLVFIDSYDDVADFAFAILCLLKTSKACGRCGTPWCNLPNQYAVFNRQIDLVLEGS